LKYRAFGTRGERLSTLALGLKQLPGCGDADKLLRTAIESGINYLDLGPGLDQAAQTRINQLTGTALQEGYRERVKLALHLPVSHINRSLDLDRFVSQQLATLLTDRIDCFFLDGLNRDTWPVVQRSGMLRRIESAIANGSIDLIGFSFRDQYQCLREITEGYDNWALCQFEYSYMDADHYPGLSGLRLANEKGLAVVVAEPLKGGRLAQHPPATVAAAWGNTFNTDNLADWGMRWVWNHPEITTVLMEPDSTRQLEKNLILADNTEAGCLGVQEQLLINQVKEAYRKLKPIPCNTCRACLPCPQDIDVPRILELYNDACMYNDTQRARDVYQNELHTLEDCNECGACVIHCGRMIAILDWLEQAREIFADGK
jgi:hypothetical protein